MSWDLILNPFKDELFLFYIETEGQLAKEPAFILIPDDHVLCDGKWTLLINGVGKVGEWRTKQTALQKLRDIIKKAKYPIKVFVKMPNIEKLYFFTEKKE